MRLSILALGICRKHVHSPMVCLGNYKAELQGSSACKETFLCFAYHFILILCFLFISMFFLQLSIHGHISWVYDHVIIF